jgi:hypothetical protein
VKKAIIDLADEWGWSVVGTEFCLAAVEWMDSNKRGRGQPPLSNDQIMHVWLYIELEKHFRNIKGADAAVKAVFSEIHRVPKSWDIDVGNGLRGFGVSVDRYHTRAKRLMKDDPKLAERWKRKLEYVKKAQQKVRDDRWTAKRVGDRLNIYIAGVLVRSIHIGKKERGPKTAPS